MQFDKLHIEKAGPGVNVLIIPIEKTYFSQHSKMSVNKPIEYLLIFERKNQEISNGQFMLVFPKDKNIKEMPKNAFQDFYYQNKTQIDGTYTSVNFRDVKQFEMDVLNGERTQERLWYPKDNFNTTGIDDCTE